MYLSRHCYDKPHRCPGWAGGGWKYPKKSRCVGKYSGFLDFRLTPGDEYPKFWQFHFHRCLNCDVVAIPHITRWIDPSWVYWWVKRKIKNLYWKFEERNWK